MLENKERIGNFTSSEIWKLCTMNAKKDGFGNPALTYIEEKQIERRMQKSIDVEAHSQPLAWGTIIEIYLFKEKIGMEYILSSKETDYHPTIKGWSGSKDFYVPNQKIAEIKCYYPKKFAKYTDTLLLKDIQLLKKNYPQEYWQLVSNAIINEVSQAEAITFMPYKSELSSVREYAENYDGADQWKYRFIYEKEDVCLPHLIDGAYYKNLNKFCFEVPKKDIDFLTNRVQLAIERL